MRVPNTTSSQWNLSLHWEFCWHSHQLARIVLLVLQIANLGSCNSFSTSWPAQVVVALSAAGGLSLQAVCGSCAYWSWMVIICFVCQTALESQLLFFCLVLCDLEVCAMEMLQLGLILRWLVAQITLSNVQDRWREMVCFCALMCIKPAHGKKQLTAECRVSWKSCCISLDCRLVWSLLYFLSDVCSKLNKVLKMQDCNF